MIAVCSLFKDSQKWWGNSINQVDRYIEQLLNQTIGFENLDIYCLEGHSHDNTYSRLLEYNNQLDNVHVYKDDGPSVEVCSNERPERFAALSRIGNLALSNIDLTQPYTHVLWVESDLIVEPNVIQELVTQSLEHYLEETIIAPITKIQTGNKTLFYDTWGFRDLNGKRWTNYHYPTSGQHMMSSIGSCALIDITLIRKNLNFGEGCFVELCRRASNMGATIIADCDISVYHPSNRLIRGRWI